MKLFLAAWSLWVVSLLTVTLFLALRAVRLLLPSEQAMRLMRGELPYDWENAR